MYESAQRSTPTPLDTMSPELAEALRSLDALRDSLQRNAGHNAAAAAEAIPVLHDIIKPGHAAAIARQRALDGLRDTLHGELDALVDDMICDARNRFEMLLEQSSEELKTAVRGRLEAHLADSLLKICPDA